MPLYRHKAKRAYTSNVSPFECHWGRHFKYIAQPDLIKRFNYNKQKG